MITMGNISMNSAKFSTIVLVLFVISTAVQITPEVYAQSSTHYWLVKETIGAVAQRSASASYQLNGTLGQPSAISRMTAINYRLSLGYWQGLDCHVYLPVILK
jgi:hypothetical protein